MDFALRNQIRVESFEKPVPADGWWEAWSLTQLWSVIFFQGVSGFRVSRGFQSAIRTCQLVCFSARKRDWASQGPSRFSITSQPLQQWLSHNAVMLCWCPRLQYTEVRRWLFKHALKITDTARCCHRRFGDDDTLFHPLWEAGFIGDISSIYI